MMKKIVYLVILLALTAAACSPAIDTSDRSQVQPTTTLSESTVATEALEHPTSQVDASATEDPGQGDTPEGRAPPQEAIDACLEKDEYESCEFKSHRGQESGICEMVQGQLACSPGRGEGREEPAEGNQADLGGAAYNIEQAISDRAQGTTIAFDALGFLTGNLGADSFFPPGKVADFWGFQYLRDNDPTEMGHNTDFLTKAAFNMLSVLSPEQRAELVALAEGQVDSINDYALMRFVLMDAFRRLLADDLPAGTSGLDMEAVVAYSADLYRLDGEISFERARVMGRLISAFDEEQRAYLDAMRGKGMLDWPDVNEPADMRGLDRDVKVAVMTYASDMFSWYVGSIEADVYFCPERQGTYFGSFYLKDAPAVGNSGYNIPTNLTGDMGDAMLETLNADQAQLVTELVEIQHPYLLEIVEARRAVATELRRFMYGGSADYETVMNLMEEYGELDGAIVYGFAVNFALVNETLSREQLERLTALRFEMLGSLMLPDGAFLYAHPIPMPEIPNTDFLFLQTL